MKAWLYRRHRNSWRTTWFSSHGTRTFERRDYHAIGVREYVIVDHLQRTVLVLLWKQGATPGFIDVHGDYDWNSTAHVLLVRGP